MPILSFSIFFRFGMFGPRKIWQPCLQPLHSKTEEAIQRENANWNLRSLYSSKSYFSLRIF
jgi:hypothetical protein